MPSPTRHLPALLMGLLFLMTSVPLSNAASVSSIPMIFAPNGTSSSVNWSGYAVYEPGGGVSAVQGSWIVPRVDCAPKEKSDSSFWVGIDGYLSSTVEQTGTSSDCSKGTPTYSAWYEFYPKASTTIGSITVSPGNVISASVSYVSGSTFEVSIQDVTTGATFSTSGTVSNAARSSGEFIVEAPAKCVIKCKISALSDFGTVSFGQDYTGVSGYNCGVEVGSTWADLGAYGSAVDEITMVSQSSSSVVKAQPSALSADGTSFTVQWSNAGP